MTNDEARQNVAKLLEKAGIPHEIRVARKCLNFCKSHANSHIHVETENIVYSAMPQDSSEEKYREVDQMVSFYQEYKVNTFTGVQLSLNVPIECKCREQVSYFAFPLESQKSASFPIGSDFAGSRYFASLYGSFKPLLKLPTARITQAKEKNGTPNVISQENLMYNAGGALYDFIHFALSQHAGYFRTPEDILKLFTQWTTMQTALKSCDWYKTHQLLKNVSVKRCNQFNKDVFGGSCIYHMVLAHLPIVCISGPLFSVKLDKLCNVIGFKECPYVTTSIRKQGWPGSARFLLLDKTPEVPVVVTSLSGLERILKIGLAWFESIADVLTTQPNEKMVKWPLETIVRSYFWQQKEMVAFDSRFYHLEDGEIDGLYERR